MTQLRGRTSLTAGLGGQPSPLCVASNRQGPAFPAHLGAARCITFGVLIMGRLDDHCYKPGQKYTVGAALSEFPILLITFTKKIIDYFRFMFKHPQIELNVI